MTNGVPGPESATSRPPRFHYRVRLRTRIFLSLTALLAVIMSMVLLLVESRMGHMLEIQAQLRVSTIGRSLAGLAQPFLMLEPSDFLQRTALQAMHEEKGAILEVVILDRDGFLAAHTGRPDLLNTRPQQPSLRQAVGLRTQRLVPYGDPDGPPERGYTVYSPILDPNGDRVWGVVRVVFSTEAMHREIAETRHFLLWLSAIGFGFGALASYSLARRVTGPISYLVSGTNRAAQGHLDTRLTLETGDELEELARSFNHMIQEIGATQDAVANMNQMLEARVRERTEDLSRMNDELRTAYAELTQVEAQVIAAEKMASLGQLVAGICHEINTPNSAINAAVANIAEYLANLNRQLRLLLADGVPPSVERRFFGLVEKALTTDLTKRRASTTEVRQQSRLLEAKLTLYGLRNPRELALTFCRIGFQDDIVEVIEAMRDVPTVSAVLCLNFLENVGRLAVAVNDIRSSADTITRLVKALKSYVRTEKARKGYMHLDQADMEEVDLHEGIETVLTLLGSQLKYGVTIERHYGELPHVICSSSELNQVWTNIIHNAVQAMKGVGKISIETFRREHGVSVKITDSGPGIPKEHVTRIFDPFFTTKDQGVGSGLGLSISQQIVERHQGEIRVQSEPGRTTFEVLLPLQPTLLAKQA
jgi:signal transduction histidine kinase